MIKAKITSKAGTSLEWELPANIHELHHALVEMGIRKTPRSLLLMDDNAANVELTADSEIGKGLLRVFGRNDTLADANTVAFAVSTAREEILSELEQNIVHDQYPTKEGGRWRGAPCPMQGDQKHRGHPHRQLPGLSDGAFLQQL